MHPLVRNLYKRFVVVGKDYPLGWPYVRGHVHKAFEQNRHLESEEDIKMAVYKGRRMVKEMIGIIQLKKYRTLRKRQ
jgi:hypothetical protein